MALNNSQKQVVSQRRELVAGFRLRKRTMREIVGDLTEAGCINPDSDEPWSLATVASDIKSLEAEWRRNAAEAIERRKALQLAEIEEAKRQAWEQGDINQVRLLIKLESELFGTEAPKRQEMTGDAGPMVIRLMWGDGEEQPEIHAG